MLFGDDIEVRTFFILKFDPIVLLERDDFLMWRPDYESEISTTRSETNNLETAPDFNLEKKLENMRDTVKQIMSQ